MLIIDNIVDYVINEMIYDLLPLYINNLVENMVKILLY